MKRSFLVHLVVLGLIVSFGGAGCKHKGVGLTPIPARSATIQSPNANNPPTVPPAENIREQNPIGTNITPPTSPGGNFPQGNLKDFEGRPADSEIFKNDTVYFDFDKSSIKPGEKSKIEAVADNIKKGPPGNDLVVEGHCDERGTEEYNRALGERRALAIRDYLINLGIGANRIRTISYGEDRPADPGHDETAWAKNRRGEFLLLLPKP